MNQQIFLFPPVGAPLRQAENNHQDENHDNNGRNSRHKISPLFESAVLQVQETTLGDSAETVCLILYAFRESWEALERLERLELTSAFRERSARRAPGKHFDLRHGFHRRSGPRDYAFRLVNRLAQGKQHGDSQHRGAVDPTRAMNQHNFP